MTNKMKSYKGCIMLFGLFRIRKDVAYYQETSGSPNYENNTYIKRLEPFLRKFCTIKWIEIDILTEKELCIW